MITHFLFQVGTPDPLPNWRQVPGFPVFGLGQPTEKGLSQVSGLGVKAQKAEGSAVIFLDFFGFWAALKLAKHCKGK